MNKLSKVDLQPLRQVLSAWSDLGPHHLIAVLQKAQDMYGYLPEEAMELISEIMRIPVARIYGVVTFYAQFRREPRGLHVVEICNGTACHVKGADRIIDELVSVLGIRPGQTTDDGRFTLLQVNCVGACGIAPAMVLDGKVYGHMTSAKVRELVEPLLEGIEEPAGTGQRKTGVVAEERTFLDRCCDKCRNAEGTPCPEFLICKLEDKPCHDDEQCAAYRRELRNLLRFEAERYRAHIFLCKGLTCEAGGAAELRHLFEEELSRHNLLQDVEIVETGCQGLCEMGPVVQIKPLEAFYCRVKPEDVAEIVAEHIAGGKPVERLLYSRDCRIEADIPFYKNQERRVLSNMGRIDPRNIDEYIARNGYLALYKAIRHSAPEEIIDIISRSGLRGRGGGGFPTGRKWATARTEQDPVKYLICNADEGDPGAFMDRSLLEGDPHRVLEGMIIAAYAIGAHKAFIYVRAEYPLAVKHLQTAIGQAGRYGLLGGNILGSGYDLNIEIFQGAGAFVCGEETALIASLEGKRGMAGNKPPYPTEHGFGGHPTCVNNVETFANVPLILAHGPEWFRSVGTQSSPGTKIFSLSGKVRYTGLVEVPMGVSMADIIFRIGGGAPEGGEIKAAQTGGPSGGCIPSALMNTAVDYDSLKELGSIMGSGGLVVTDDSTCIVSFARFFLSFTQHESCGKCIPCREGTKRMLEILERITRGQGKLADLDDLRNLCHVIQRTSSCGLGQTSPNPVLSTLRYFEDEYLAHINDKRCPAGVCRSLLTYHILDNCRSCGLCAKNCPVACISGSKGAPYVIDQDACIKCGKCYEVCPFNAVART